MARMPAPLSSALCLVLASVTTAGQATVAGSAGICVASDGLQACAAGGGITFARGNRTIVTSSALIAAGRRIALKAAATSADQKTLTLELKDTIRTPGRQELKASYSVHVTINAGRFEVSVDGAATGPPPAPTPTPPCTDGSLNSGLNPAGGDLRHFRQQSDSPDPTHCRAACCNATDCDVWALMSTGVPGLGAPCVAGKPCCYMKSAAATPAAKVFYAC